MAKFKCHHCGFKDVVYMANDGGRKLVQPSGNSDPYVGFSRFPVRLPSYRGNGKRDPLVQGGDDGK